MATHKIITIIRMTAKTTGAATGTVAVDRRWLTAIIVLVLISKAQPAVSGSGASAVALSWR